MLKQPTAAALAVLLAAVPAAADEPKSSDECLKRAIDLAEAAKRRHEEARNTLEGYLYRVRDLLSEDGETPFRKCSKEEERAAIERVSRVSSCFEIRVSRYFSLHFRGLGDV